MLDRKDQFHTAVVALMPKLRRFAFSLCGAPHDADDLVQSAIERALRNREQYQPETRLDSWMYRIVQNLWIDQGRQRRTRGDFLPLDAAATVMGEDGRAKMGRRAAAAKALEVFGALAPEIRSAATLVIINGDSYKEASETLNVPIGTVASRVARARAALDEALKDEDYP